MVFAEEPALFRLARIFYEDGRDEEVAVPLLYGTSWQSPNELDRDGSMTRLLCHQEAGERSWGIGVGHQDLSVFGPEGQWLFGIGSVGAINMAER